MSNKFMKLILSREFYTKFSELIARVSTQSMQQIAFVVVDELTESIYIEVRLPLVWIRFVIPRIK